MISLIRFAPRLGDTKKNLQTIEKAASHAIDEGCVLALFPELICSGYQLENLVSESALTPDAEEFVPLLKLSSHCDIVVGCPMLIGSSYHNSIIVFREGRVLKVYHKIYLPTYGMFDEGRYFKAGETLGVYDGGLGRTGLLVCEDAWHPAVAYAVHAAGAELVLVPSASPARGLSVDDIHHSASMWRSRLSIYAESFGTSFFYVNIAGTEDGVRYGGEAFMAAPGGEIKTGKYEEWESIRFTHFEWNAASRHSAATIGGPWQNESHARNYALLEQAKKLREKNG